MEATAKKESQGRVGIGNIRGNAEKDTDEQLLQGLEIRCSKRAS